MNRDPYVYNTYIVLYIYSMYVNYLGIPLFCGIPSRYLDVMYYEHVTKEPANTSEVYLEI